MGLVQGRVPSVHFLVSIGGTGMVANTAMAGLSFIKPRRTDNNLGISTQSK